MICLLCMIVCLSLFKLHTCARLSVSVRSTGDQGSCQEEVNRAVPRGSDEHSGEGAAPGAAALWRRLCGTGCVCQQFQLACADGQAGTMLGPGFPVAWLTAVGALSLTDLR